MKGPIRLSTQSQNLPEDLAVTLDRPGNSPLALTGGFEGSFLPNGVKLTQSYPSGPQSWTFKARQPGRTNQPGQAFLVCGQSDSLGTTIRSASLRNGAATISCPSGTYAVGGGLSNNAVISSSRPKGVRSWLVRASTKTARGTGYAVCLGPIASLT